jgi:hypothetical protein
MRAETAAVALGRDYGLVAGAVSEPVPAGADGLQGLRSLTGDNAVDGYRP